MHVSVPDLSDFETDRDEYYVRHYLGVCNDLIERPIVLFEMGVRHSDSLRLWKTLFPLAVVIGLDMEPVEGPFAEGTRFYQGRQEDTRLLDEIASECAPTGFDLIVDDASHIAADARPAFHHLFHHHLKPGGIYAIEDWGTGYWSAWPDGTTYEPQGTEPEPASVVGHQSGMVGFVKSLVDQVGMADIARDDEQVSDTGTRADKMVIVPGLAFLVKA